MPAVRPATELKHPNLQGEYPCQYCDKVFRHNASLRRHRSDHHSNDQQCLLCHEKLSSSDSVRRHMMMAHEIETIYTCGCCNWSFKERKDLRTHILSMEETGKPGEGLAVAMCGAKPSPIIEPSVHEEKRQGAKPGPVIQSSVHEEKRPLKRKYSKCKSPPPCETLLDKDPEKLMTHFTKLVSEFEPGQPGEGLAVAMCGAKPGPLIQSAAHQEKRPLKRKYSKRKSPPPCETHLDKDPEELMALFSNLVSKSEPISDDSDMEIEIIPIPKVKIYEDKENIKIVKMDLGKAFNFQLVLKPFETTPSPSSISDLSKIFGAPIVFKTQDSVAEMTPSSSSISPNSDVFVKVQKGKKRHSIDDICLKLALKKYYV